MVFPSNELIMKINKTKYKVTKDNYYHTKNTKNQILIGFSMRKKDYHIKRLQNKELGKSKKWNTFTITREGVIYQHFPDENHSDYVGNKKADIQTITIVLENMGVLTKSEETYYNWINEVCEYDVGERKWVGYEYWEEIPEKQYDSLIKLLDMLTTKHNIPKQTIGFITHNRDVLKFKGITFMSNYDENTLNMNPLLSYKKIDEHFETIEK